VTPESRSGLALQAMLAEQLLAGAQETEVRAWELADIDGREQAVEATLERMVAEATLTLARKAAGEESP
jgi:hypothetical protein